jgi:RNA polymerase sigma-70 factor (ECF subfamily)
MASTTTRAARTLATIAAHERRPLLAVARRVLRTDDEADDAVQDALLSAVRSSERFEERAQMGTWLHRIVLNAALMRLRARRRRPEVAMTDMLPRFLDDGRHAAPVHGWHVPLEHTIERAETRARVRAAIARLPERYRDVIVLRDIRELDTEETAAVLGISAATVKTRLHRARQALRTLLAPYFAA